MTDQKSIKAYLRKTLSEKRYQHSVRTAETAERLCNLYGEDPEKGLIAGLLHDIAREKKYDELIPFVEENGVKITENEKKYPVLLHGRAGAIIAEKEFEIKDNDILEAIRWHTTGKKEMCNLASILYIADYIEPGRKHVTNEFRKRIQNMKLDKVVMEILKDSIAYCRMKGYSVAEQTLMLYHELEKKVS